MIFARFDAIINNENAKITYNANTPKRRIGEGMQIHIKKKGESLQNIAEIYGISEDSLRMTNGIIDGEAADGEELLILTPTRSYTVQYGDTPERISLRFGIRRADLCTLNPWIKENKLEVGQRLSLKYTERPCGMAVANGYYYKGCSDELLTRAMPYLTYITFAGAVADDRGVRCSADFSEQIAKAKEKRKIPLLRVYDRFPERYKAEDDKTAYAEELISLALEGGYKGIVMDACSLSDSAKEFPEFLMILRKLMIGCDLILITEINEESPLEFSEYADGSVMYYPKYAMDNPPSFNEGERAVLSDFACRGESAKTFVDLPSLARRGVQYTTTADALNTARRYAYTVEHNESTLLSNIRDRKQGEYSFSSLRNIKALLDLVNELDYMGICFDIMRTPLSHLMMYNAMFKTHYFNSVRTREGCSHGGEA